ncbi:MAG: Rho GTPase activation protein [Piptocephalis tieghemiana]|nr:MAG: Rho GTPase activation protein [Piptocephalis tieghemiana]
MSSVNQGAFDKPAKSPLPPRPPDEAKDDTQGSSVPSFILSGSESSKNVPTTITTSSPPDMLQPPSSTPSRPSISSHTSVAPDHPPSTGQSPPSPTDFPASPSIMQRIQLLTQAHLGQHAPPPEGSFTQKAMGMANLAADKGSAWGAYARETKAELSRRFDAWKRSMDQPHPESTAPSHPASSSSSSSKRNPQLFGLPLDQLPTVDTPYGLIPRFLRRAISYLEEKGGIEEEGIYRISGRQSTIMSLRHRLDAGEDVDLTSISPHVVAALLKLFFRELPSSLFPTEFRASMTFAPTPHPTQGLGSEHPPETRPIEPSVEYLRESLNALPAMSRAILALLFIHLRCVSDLEQLNRMSVHNLAVIFCPTLGIQGPVFRALLAHATTLFPPSDSQEKPRGPISVGSNLTRSKTDGLLHRRRRPPLLPPRPAHLTSINSLNLEQSTDLTPTGKSSSSSTEAQGGLAAISTNRQALPLEGQDLGLLNLSPRSSRPLSKLPRRRTATLIAQFEHKSHSSSSS